MRTFLDLGLPESLAGGLSTLGFSSPTDIQIAALPTLLAGRDLLMESETGTGKTFAFLAPALAIAAESGNARVEGPIALIAAPTQELAVQIGKESEKLAKAAGLNLHSVVLLGGTPLEKQEAKLRERPHIVVGTLGRLADLVALKRLKTTSLRFLVLDEADRLLAPETEQQALALLAAVPHACVRVLASATLPARTRRSAAPHLRDPSIAETTAKPVLAGDIEHWCFYCDGRKRLDFIRRFEAAIKPQRCLVFMTNSSRIPLSVERLESFGLPVDGIHAKLEKESRRVALDRFAAGELRYLVTSDLGARGLDIAGLSHVISLDLPDEPTIYVHRAGRTGRAGAHGTSIVLADGVELARASRIAVREGFVFRCKVMEKGEVVEPPAEDFFSMAEKAESERRAYRDIRRTERASGSAESGSYASPEHGRSGESRSPENRRSFDDAARGRAGGSRPSFPGRDRSRASTEPAKHFANGRPKRPKEEGEGGKA